jgi:kynurenine formamidase
VTGLPSYDELPDGSSWGLWGPDDVFGCLNLLTPERVRRGAECVRKGAVFALNLDQTLPDPPLFGRPPLRREVTWLTNDAGHDEILHEFNTQSSSQWDGFRHIQHPVRGFYNGVPDEDHGIGHWASAGIAGRGVLADVARWRESQGRPITPNAPDPIEPDDLLATLETQTIRIEPGDVLLIRTGWLTWYRSLDKAGREEAAATFQACGLRPGRETARTLWDLHIAAVAADNPALEVWPPAAVSTPEQLAAIADDRSALGEVFVHIHLLPLLGIPIGELWDLDALAADCAADGVYECFLTSAPLNLPSGVASPPNALAIK